MKKVIVIDDSPAVGTLIARMLEETEFLCTALTSAEDLLDRLQSEPVDMLITDILMPNIDGIELILSVHAAFPYLPILAISGGGKSVGMEVLHSARQLGASAILAKPFTRGELLAAMQAAARRTS